MEQLTFDCRRGTERDSFDAYRSLYRIGTDVTRTEGDFFATIGARRFRRLLVFDRTLAGLSHERTPRRAATDDFDHVVVQLVLSGNLGVEIGEERRLVGPGAMVAFDMRRPQRTWTAGARFLTVSLARDLVDATLPAGVDFHGRIFAEGTAPVLPGLVRSLAAWDGTLDATMADAASTSVGLLLGALLGAGASPSRATANADLKFKSAMRVIRENVGRIDLSADWIAERVGVSRSVLYRMFEPHGGVARTIKRQRLLAMRNALAMPSDVRPIATLARDCGFVSDAHANRSFREEFGLTPGDYRATRRVTDPDMRVSHRFEHWFDDFG